jgi:uncharacterized membrane protein YeiH
VKHVLQYVNGHAGERRFVQVQTIVDSINLSADFRPRGCKFKSHWHHQAFFTITVSTITTVTGGIMV